MKFAIVCGVASMVVASVQPGPLSARERIVLPPGWHIGQVRIQGGASASRETQRRRASASSRRADRTADRALTINREFSRPSNVDRSDPLEFGTFVYGDVRSFNPFPTVTSGTQLPYGLDGIGGFGSDVGFSAGSDSALYDRGG